MENAADALKMACAVFIFIIALSIVFSLIGKVKETADAVMNNSDKTNYYEWYFGDKYDKGRSVGRETVVASLYNSGEESTSIYISSKTGNLLYQIEDGVVKQPETENIQEVVEEILENPTTNYKENIVEIITKGEYREAEDGTRITIYPGATNTYIYYTAE